MQRGEIWTLSGGPDYAGKPRPAIILQDDNFSGTASITVCGLTTNPTDAPLLRPVVTPNERNGLRAPSRIMADKISTVPRTKLGQRIGQLDARDIVRLNRALVVFLGLAESPRNQYSDVP